MQAAQADDYVNGYTRSNGTTVQGYYRTSPDGNPGNNYSTQGNYNPYTGHTGTVSPTSSYGGYGGQTYGGAVDMNRYNSAPLLYQH